MKEQMVIRFHGIGLGQFREFCAFRLDLKDPAVIRLDRVFPFRANRFCWMEIFPPWKEFTATRRIVAERCFFHGNNSTRDGFDIEGFSCQCVVRHIKSETVLTLHGKRVLKGRVIRIQNPRVFKYRPQFLFYFRTESERLCHFFVAVPVMIPSVICPFQSLAAEHDHPAAAPGMISLRKERSIFFVQLYRFRGGSEFFLECHERTTVGNEGFQFFIQFHVQFCICNENCCVVPIQNLFAYIGKQNVRTLSIRGGGQETSFIMIETAVLIPWVKDGEKTVELIIATDVGQVPPNLVSIGRVQMPRRHPSAKAVCNQCNGRVHDAG